MKLQRRQLLHLVAGPATATALAPRDSTKPIRLRSDHSYGADCRGRPRTPRGRGGPSATFLRQEFARKLRAPEAWHNRIRSIGMGRYLSSDFDIVQQRCRFRTRLATAFWLPLRSLDASSNWSMRSERQLDSARSLGQKVLMRGETLANSKASSRSFQLTGIELS